jgi:hypothetical protein
MVNQANSSNSTATRPQPTSSNSRQRHLSTRVRVESGRSCEPWRSTQRRSGPAQFTAFGGDNPARSGLGAGDRLVQAWIGLAVPAGASGTTQKLGVARGGGHAGCYWRTDGSLSTGVSTEASWLLLPDVSVCLNPEKGPIGPGGGASRRWSMVTGTRARSDEEVADALPEASGAAGHAVGSHPGGLGAAHAPAAARAGAAAVDRLAAGRPLGLRPQQGLPERLPVHRRPRPGAHAGHDPRQSSRDVRPSLRGDQDHTPGHHRARIPRANAP